MPEMNLRDKKKGFINPFLRYATLNQMCVSTRKGSIDPKKGL